MPNTNPVLYTEPRLRLTQSSIWLPKKHLFYGDMNPVTSVNNNIREVLNNEYIIHEPKFLKPDGYETLYTRFIRHQLRDKIIMKVSGMDHMFSETLYSIYNEIEEAVSLDDFSVATLLINLPELTKPPSMNEMVDRLQLLKDDPSRITIVNYIY